MERVDLMARFDAAAECVQVHKRRQQQQQQQQQQHHARTSTVDQSTLLLWCAALEAWCHQLLYARKVYSSETFEMYRFLGMTCRMQQNAEVISYIHEAVEVAAKSLLDTCIRQDHRNGARATEVCLAILETPCSTDPIEQYTISFQPSHSMSNAPCARAQRQTVVVPKQWRNVEELESQVRDLILRVKSLEGLIPYPPFVDTLTFQVQLYIEPPPQPPTDAAARPSSTGGETKHASVPAQLPTTSPPLSSQHLTQDSNSSAFSVRTPIGEPSDASPYPRASTPRLYQTDESDSESSNGDGVHGGGNNRDADVGKSQVRCTYPEALKNVFHSGAWCRIPDTSRRRQNEARRPLLDMPGSNGVTVQLWMQQQQQQRQRQQMRRKQLRSSSNSNGNGGGGNGVNGNERPPNDEATESSSLSSSRLRPTTTQTKLRRSAQHPRSTQHSSPAPQQSKQLDDLSW